MTDRNPPAPRDTRDLDPRPTPPEHALPGNALPGNALPGNALPGNALPGNALPGNALPGHRPLGYAPPGNALADTDDAVLTLPDGARALFTSQIQGNLSSVCGDRHEQGARARTQLRDALGVRRLVRGYQVHGTVVGRIPSEASPGAGEREDAPPTLHNGLSHDETDASQPAFRADGHAVAVPGVAAMVLVADCTPVVLCARGAVAALHAGWRGLAAGILEEGMRALRDVGGEGPAIAAIGPCAGVCCYEVGAEVHAALSLPAPTRPRPIDLRAIARERLLAAGASQVIDVGGCTICDERFFSHRREGPRAGRQAALAWLA